MSSAPSATSDQTMKNGELWEEALFRAKKSGILVFDTMDSVQSCYLDYNDGDDLSKCFLGKSFTKCLQDKKLEEQLLSSIKYISSIYDFICALCGFRTMAEERKLERFSYIYSGPSQSASIPVLSGILALGLQVSPNISDDELLKALKDTSYTLQNGFKVVNPKEFVLYLTSDK